jgi:hypothetical protein
MHGLQSFKRDLGRCLKVRGNKLGRHPEERRLGRVSKDGRECERCIHPSRRRASARLLRMTAVFVPGFNYQKERIAFCLKPGTKRSARLCRSRHCERSEAIHWAASEMVSWIASSLRPSQ